MGELPKSHFCKYFTEKKLNNLHSEAMFRNAIQSIKEKYSRPAFSHENNLY